MLGSKQVRPINCCTLGADHARVLAGCISLPLHLSGRSYGVMVTKAHQAVAKSEEGVRAWRPSQSCRLLCQGIRHKDALAAFTDPRVTGLKCFASLRNPADNAGMAARRKGRGDYTEL